MNTPHSLGYNLADLLRRRLLRSRRLGNVAFPARRHRFRSGSTWDVRQKDIVVGSMMLGALGADVWCTGALGCACLRLTPARSSSR